MGVSAQYNIKAILKLIFNTLSSGTDIKVLSVSFDGFSTTPKMPRSPTEFAEFVTARRGVIPPPITLILPTGIQLLTQASTAIIGLSG